MKGKLTVPWNCSSHGCTVPQDIDHLSSSPPSCLINRTCTLLGQPEDSIFNCYETKVSYFPFSISFLNKIRVEIMKTYQKRILVLVLVVVFSSIFSTCYGSGGKQWRGRKHASRGRAYLVPSGTTVPLLDSKGGGSTITTFNVLDYGAKGDGKTDETKVIFQAKPYLLFNTLKPALVIRIQT